MLAQPPAAQLAHSLSPSSGLQQGSPPTTHVSKCSLPSPGEAPASLLALSSVIGLPAPEQGNHCPRVTSKPPGVLWEAVRLPQNTAAAFEPPLMGHAASSQPETVSPLAQHILGSYPRAQSRPFFPLTGCFWGVSSPSPPFPSNFSLPLISSLYNSSILSSVQRRRSVSTAVGRLARQQADSDPRAAWPSGADARLSTLLLWDEAQLGEA